MLLSNRYADEKVNSFTFSDETCQLAYEENPDQYDVVNYRVFYMRADIPTGATSAEKTKALQEAEDKANEMLENITDSESFRKLCIDYASEEDQVTYRTEDVSLQRNKHQKDVTQTAQKTWLFDAEREPSDKTVIESSSGYYVLFFESRSKPEFPWAHVRHILIQANQDSADEAAIKAAKEQAESILAEYESGEKTEEAFAELAREYSEDGNASQGGLYENIYPGQMVEPFEDWCFDPNRKVGDTGIVQTDFGFHVMYYSGQAGPDWKMNVTQTLRDKAYAEYVEEEVKNYPYKIHSLGYRLVG
jgi:predicted DNA binding CopG/RHH family protein